MEIQKLMLAEDVFNQLEAGKQVTIRKGRRDIQLGRLLFESTEKKRKQIVEVVRVLYCQLYDIPESFVKADGFSDHEEMLELMKRFYPNIDRGTECTTIEFFVL